MNNVKAENVQVKRVEPIALLDCGQASKVTKGFPFFWLWEFTPPPYDTALL